MAALKPVYLVHGDDHGAIAERRSSLKALGEREAGPAGVEILPVEESTPAGVANALAALTIALNLRVIIVDGAERFKQAQVESDLSPSLRNMPPQTTLAFFAREDGKVRAPKALHDAVKTAKGQIVAHETVKQWDLPKWTKSQAQRLGIAVDVAASKALIAQVGPRQQRLLRELEKLALEVGADPNGGEPVPVSAKEIELAASHSAQQRTYALGDALLASDLRSAISTYVALAAQGERMQGLTYVLASRLREALAVAERLQEGHPHSEVNRSLKMPPKAAERFLREVERQDVEKLREALVILSDVELDLRGGSKAKAYRRPRASLSEQALAIEAIFAIASSEEPSQAL